MDWPAHPREIGLVTTAEAIASTRIGGLGMTERAIAWAIESGKWQRIHRGVFLDRPGPIDWMTRAGGALLAYGDESALWGPSAAVIHGLAPMPSLVLGRSNPPIHIVVPPNRRPGPHRGTIVRYSDVSRVVSLWPRRTAYESTVIDLLAGSSPDQVTAIIAMALRDRRTTPARLRAELDRRTRFPHRAIVRDVLTEVKLGSESPLEVRFVRNVLHRHGLPRGVGQWSVSHLGLQPDRRRFDRAIPEFWVLIELDGALYHRGSALAADRRKSNAAARHGWLLLRFGWDECTVGACASAIEIAAVLASRGWWGKLRACGQGCQALTHEAAAS